MYPTLARHKNRIAWAALAAVSLFLGACVTGVEDQSAIDPEFKDAHVDADVAARTLADGYAESQTWGSLTTAPAGIASLGNISTGIGGLQGTAALAKTAADIGIGDGLMANLDDTGKGFATVYRKYMVLLNSVEDTVIVKWDDKARDTVKDNETLISFKRVNRGLGGLRVETTEITDADGDGMVNALPGGENKVKLVFTVQGNGTAEKTELTADAGPDADFDTEGDNIIYSARWTRSKNGVVIGTGSFADADNDGVVVDNAKDCVVLAAYSDLEPKDRPLIKQADFKAKVKVLAHKAGTEPISLSYVETTKLGRTNSVTMRNRNGGEEIIRGDTMYVRLETVKTADDDTLRHAVVEFAMNPGQDLNSDSDDVCYGIHIESDKRFGLERHAEFDFTSATPIPHGQAPTAGTFSGKADYANGQSATLTGSFSPDGFTVEFTGPDGTAKLELDRNGAMASNP